MMENDPNKNESKGKRLFKKAVRRNSKTNNGSQQSAQSLSVTRSKSFEIKQRDDEVSDSAPLPTPDGPHDKAEDKPGRLDQNTKTRKSVDIHEEQNQVFKDKLATHREGNERSLDFDQNIQPESSKRGVKRKLEEESGAGTSGTSTGASDTDADDKDPSKDKKKKNRCAVCRKKVGLTGFECRCGGLFCAVHRYSDKHECSFDYRELGAQEIRRNNPVVVSQKIHKI